MISLQSGASVRRQNREANQIDAREEPSADIFAEILGRDRRLTFFVTHRGSHMNCSKHILRRFPETAVAPVVDQLQARVEELQAEVAKLRVKLCEAAAAE